MVALADVLPRSSKSSVAVRAKWMIGLVQRSISSMPPGAAPGSSGPCQLGRMLGKREHAAARRVARGLVACDHDDQAVGEDVERRELLAVDLGGRESEMRSSAGFFFFSSTSFAKYWNSSIIACRPVAAAPSAFGTPGRPHRSCDWSSRRADASPSGHAEQPCDHRDGKRRRRPSRRNRLALGPSRAARPRSPWRSARSRRGSLERPGREARADDLAVLAVLRRVDLDQRRRKFGRRPRSVRIRGAGRTGSSRDACRPP